MLREISNFVIADIWNVGFVDVISYTRSGTSSTGASMDIDFTIEQLGKAMEEKKVYDTYMNELDIKYDSIKKYGPSFPQKLIFYINRFRRHLQKQTTTA